MRVSILMMTQWGKRKKFPWIHCKRNTCWKFELAFFWNEVINFNFNTSPFSDSQSSGAISTAESVNAREKLKPSKEMAEEERKMKTVASAQSIVPSENGSVRSKNRSVRQCQCQYLTMRSNISEVFNHRAGVMTAEEHSASFRAISDTFSKNSV